MKSMQITCRHTVLLLCLLLFLLILPCLAAADVEYFPVSGKNYVLQADSAFDETKGEKVENFFYGSDSLGLMRVNGHIENQTTINDTTAFGVDDVMYVYYAYHGKYKKDKPEKWYIDNDGTRWLRSYDVGFLSNIGSGCIMVERSPDKINWEKVIEPKKDYFKEAKSVTDSLLFWIPESEVKNGMYYRVVVAYKMAKKIDNGYDVRKCMEVYEFYVSSNINYVGILDMGNGAPLENEGITETGFQINKYGNKATVRVQGEPCNNFDCFTEPGDYVVDVTTELGKEYSTKVTISDGVDFTPLESMIYRSEKDQGFSTLFPVAATVYGGNLTSLSLVTPKGIEIVRNDNKYGIRGKSISLYMKLNKDINNMGLGWVLNHDQWGKNKNEQIAGVGTAEIGKGALIIQTSKDGYNWTTADKGRYTEGLYTTDYAANYGKAENVLIYTPAGEDVLNGVHIRVRFAYQVYRKESNEYRDYLEEYTFYLCSNELEAVTFHNLSINETLEEQLKDADQNTIEVYKKAETMESGDYTASGFSIDRSLNPTVNYTVLRNGTAYDEPQINYQETGKYDITLTSMVGDTREVTIYVDQISPEDAMKLYFGDGFISGKRIFSEGDHPVYEGGEFTYHLEAVDENTLPLYGQITNLYTGSVITIEQSHEERSGTITEPGEYQAIFATGEKVFTGEFSGDARVFTLHFSVIAQGTAPGPVVNQRLLDDYRHTTAFDSNPVFYGLTYQSAGKGNITKAFASKEAAVLDAYDYEKGTVESQEGGSYRYSGSFIVDRKVKYDSTWDLTEIVNYLSEAAVHRQYFDMSDEFTYLSMRPEFLEKYPNLRKLELTRSITIFADDKQKEELTDIDALPLLNNKPYAYLNPETNKVEQGAYSFEFITDQYGGLDSKSVIITDSEGKQHPIRYSESVGMQLEADQCPSGIVTIREETMYGDVAEYQAVYIAPGENQTEITLEYSTDGEEHSVACSSSVAMSDIVADYFTVSNLNDPLDPYAFVVVKHRQNEEVFTSKDSINRVWNEPGEYQITCLNRMGYGYTIPIRVAGTEVAEDEPVIPEITLQPTSVSAQKATDTAPEKDAGSAGNSAEQAGNPIAADTNNDSTVPADVSKNRTNETAQENKGNSTLTIVIIIAGLAVLAFAVFAYRRIKLFSQVTDETKNGEEDKHE